MKYDLPLEQFIRTLNKISDLHETDTKDHSRRTREMSEMIAIRLGLSKESALYISWGADIHDIGKLAIDRYILRQAASLTRAQRIQVQSHTVLGKEMLAYAEVPHEIAEAVLFHHEHYDGSGYPSKLKEDNIPISARIVCIADVWDAITSQRSYRPPMPFDKALKFMNKNAMWFDPQIYGIWLNMVREQEEKWR